MPSTNASPGTPTQESSNTRDASLLTIYRHQQ